MLCQLLKLEDIYSHLCSTHPFGKFLIASICKLFNLQNTRLLIVFIARTAPAKRVVKRTKKAAGSKKIRKTAGAKKTKKAVRARKPKAAAPADAPAAATPKKLPLLREVPRKPARRSLLRKLLLERESKRSDQWSDSLAIVQIIVL